MAKWTIDGENPLEKTVNAMQRSEIARLTRALEAVTNEKLALLADIKGMRGEK